MKLIDLRSDTVTQPTDEMRKAMAAAEGGDGCVDTYEGCNDALLGCPADLASARNAALRPSPGEPLILKKTRI